MTQSWYRKGKKKAKEREQKKNRLLYWNEWIDHKMASVGYYSIVILVGFILWLLCISKADWIIAIMSLAIMVISIYNANEKKQEYKKFYFTILSFTILLYFLIYFFHNRIPDEVSSFIGTYVSGGCLYVTFIMEMTKPFKKTQADSNDKMEEYKEKCK